jgi:pilus assembly protein FimV
VRKSFLKAFGFLACFAWACVASAVGFGGINVTSSLGQPLVAEIELVAVDKADKSSLNAHLASPEAFKGAGIDYPYALPKLKFEVATHPSGLAYIKATSDKVVNEPFVSLLLELTWSSGRLLREYTFLLDPPGFVADQPPAVAVKPIEPVIESAVVPAEPIAQVAPVDIAASAPQEATSPAAPATQDAATVAEPEPVAIGAASAVAAEVTKPAETKVEPLAKEETPAANKVTDTPVPTSPITVIKGDSLGKIANQVKSADVSLERMLVALYRANAEEFDGHNMNRIQTGKILHMPEAGDLAKIKQAEAVKEVHAQVADWNAYRQKLAGTKSPAAEQRAKQEVAGKISTSIAEKAPVAKEAPKEVLKLSKGQGAGDQTVAGGKAKSAQDKANAKVDDAIANKKALKEAEQRTALLEQNVKEMQRLVELKNQAAAKTEQDKKGAASAPASAIPLIASSVAPAANKSSSSVAEAKPKPIAAPKVVAPPPSMLDELLGNPIYLGGGAAVILGLAGLGFVLFKRQKKGDAGNKKEKASSEEAGSASGRIASPVQSSPETGDFTHTITATPASTLDSDEVDPIGEAELFLNFGRDVQAEEVLKESLQKDPSNNAVKLKLMSIYVTRKDTKSLYTYALEIKQSKDDAAWALAAAMGREIEPGNELYSGGAQSTQILDAAAGEIADPKVDFDLGGFGTAEPAQKTQNLGLNKTEEKKAFSGESTSILSRDDLRSAQDVPMDFDITAAHPGTKPSPMDDPKLEVSAMDFDVSGSHVSAGSPEKSGLDIPAMDFDVTGGAVMTPAPALTAQTLNLDDLVFDVPTSAPAAKAVPVTPAATSGKDMEFTLDFPSDQSSAAPASPAAAKGVELSDISLNLDEASAPKSSGAAENKDEQWQEVATKLDLAKAYQEMGDQAGAREILEEVLRDGDESQKASAQALMQQLS